MITPSITFWNRIEPRPRSFAVDESLAARVRDPLWMLTRQWQMGEFQGEDAGSPTYVEVQARTARIDRARAGDADAFAPIDAGSPLERLLQNEPFEPDLATRVELGQTFEALLRAEGASATIDSFREAYPLPASSGVDPRDSRALRFLEICGGRALDGVAVHEAAVKAGGIPSVPTIDPALESAVKAAVSALLRWVEDVFGAIGAVQPAAWDASRLEYRARVSATGPSGDATVLEAHATRDGQFDWHSFDATSDSLAALAPAEKRAFSVIPGHVRFRGMPNARFWDFEIGTTDFASIDPQKRDLAKLMVMDFMLVHSNDWFTIPFPQDIGTLSWFESFLVHDVFGDAFWIDRADADPAATALERWSMYSIAASADGASIAPFFILPPSPAAAIQSGPTLEEVRFFRDEMAELVWAVERTAPDATGEPWSGHERNAARTPPDAATPAGTATVPLQYRIETTVPEHWTPFLPVMLDPVKGQIALQRGAVLREDGGTIAPSGRVLRPAETPYLLREEEVSRAGTWVSRAVCRSRWIDGSTHTWVSRRRGTGTGEGSSGLRYDTPVVR